jgi:hypothetical protein
MVDLMRSYFPTGLDNINDRVKSRISRLRMETSTRKEGYQEISLSRARKVTKSQGEIRPNKGVVMAKDLTPADIAAALASMGLDVPAELKSKVENSVQDKAQSYLSEHLSESDEKKKVAAAEKWQKDLFTLVDSFSAAFNGQEKNVGQGRVFERYVEIELPDGSKFALRHREPREKK